MLQDGKDKVQVPLSVTPQVKNQQEQFRLWFNGKHKVVDAPIKPYFYSYHDLHHRISAYGSTRRTC